VGRRLVFAFLYVNLRIAQRASSDPLVYRSAPEPARGRDPAAAPPGPADGRSAWRCCSGWAPQAAGWACSSSCTGRRSACTERRVWTDVGYYGFQVRRLIAGAIGLVIAVTTLTCSRDPSCLYRCARASCSRRQVTVEPSARLHLAVLIALLFVLGSVAGVPRPASGMLYSTTGSSWERASPISTPRSPPAGRGACRAGRRSAGPVGSRSQRLARNTCARGSALPRRVAARVALYRR